MYCKGERSKVKGKRGKVRGRRQKVKGKRGKEQEAWRNGNRELRNGEKHGERRNARFAISFFAVISHSHRFTFSSWNGSILLFFRKQ